MQAQSKVMYNKVCILPTVLSRSDWQEEMHRELIGIICLHAEHDFCLRAQAGYTVSVCNTIGMWYAANQKS